MLYPDAQRLHTHTRARDEPFPKSSEHTTACATNVRILDTGRHGSANTSFSLHIPSYPFPLLPAGISLKPTSRSPDTAACTRTYTRSPAEPETTASPTQNNPIEGS